VLLTGLTVDPLTQKVGVPVATGVLVDQLQ
jgi:hypothetical protein